MESPSTLKEANDNRLKHHLDQESKKYNRPAQKSGEAIIHELNEQNVTLLPLTFDEFGSMGPLATSYFFDNKKMPSITDKTILSKFPESALKAYKRGRSHFQTKMNTLFKAANKGWKLLNKDKWYGSTYQLTSPSNWGQQYLAMNLNISIVNHIKKAFSIIDKSINVQTENKKYIILHWGRGVTISGLSSYHIHQIWPVLVTFFHMVPPKRPYGNFFTKKWPKKLPYGFQSYHKNCMVTIVKLYGSFSFGLTKSYHIWRFKVTI